MGLFSIPSVDSNHSVSRTGVVVSRPFLPQLPNNPQDHETADYLHPSVSNRCELGIRHQATGTLNGPAGE